MDIPASISLAQGLSSDYHHHNNNHNNYEETSSKRVKRQKRQRQVENKNILSTHPQQRPYSTPPEPKTEKARARVLGRIPLPERVFHEDVIAPLVMGGLEVLRRECGREKWCLGRYVLGGDGELLGAGAGNGPGTGFGYDYGDEYDRGDDDDDDDDEDKPPMILSSTSENVFGSMCEIRGVPVRNSSMESAMLVIREDKGSTAAPGSGPGPRPRTRFIIPPLSTFLLSTLQMQTPTPKPKPTPNREVIKGLPTTQKFNLVLLDPPWPNRSVRRSRHYHTQSYTDMDALTRTIRDILRGHLPVALGPETSAPGEDKCMAAIWVTNSYKARMAAYEAIQGAGLVVVEEWAWVKTAVNGEAVLPVEGVWRKPYEVLVIGGVSVDGDSRAGDGDGDGVSVDRGRGNVVRRVIAAVPDVHSRKPNLKEVFEEVFFGASCYSALEVFARNLTAGWWGCGDEVLRFNSEEWWK